MAASRLLRAVAAFVILLSFAARSRKSYWSGCMKAATVICPQTFFPFCRISVFWVPRRFRAVWSVGRKECSVKCEVWSVKEAVGSEKCEVWSVKCAVWSVKFKFGVRRAQCEVWSVKCEVWSVKEAVRSEKCGVWSVKCGVWSLKFGVRRVQCAVWGVECRGKDTVGTGCLWTIGHLCLGNFRRRLARVYVTPLFDCV